MREGESGPGGRETNGGVVVGDKVAPDFHKGADEVGALLGFRGPEEGESVARVLGGGDGVLILVGDAVVVGEGLGEPVGGTDKGRFGVHVL